MATYQARTRASRVAPPTDGDADNVLDCAGPIAGAHVLVLGPAALEVLCGLIRCGAATVTCLRRDDRSTATPAADLVILPRCGDLEAASEALALAHRALAPGGHVVLRDGGSGRAPALAALLAAQGVFHIRCRARPSGAVLTADLPFFGPVGGR
jgi:hypothetical protein